MAEKKSIIVVRSTKNAEAFDKLIALGEKFRCSMSGLLSAAIEQFVANPPVELPEIAKGNARSAVPGFWIQVETDEEGKPKKVCIEEVKSRSAATGETFIRYTTNKEGEINAKSRDSALESAKTEADKICTWTGIKPPTKKDIKLLS